MGSGANVGEAADWGPGAAVGQPPMANQKQLQAGPLTRDMTRLVATAWCLGCWAAVRTRSWAAERLDVGGSHPSL